MFWTFSAEAAKVVKHPTKVECLNGVTIRLTSLGFEHSVAVTGLKYHMTGVVKLVVSTFACFRKFYSIFFLIMLFIFCYYCNLPIEKQDFLKSPF